MVAGSRLNMARRVSCPGPSERCAMGMNQLVEKNLSCPRGLVCCVSTRKTLAWNISIQLPFMVMSMGAGVEFGCELVPEDAWCSIAWIKVFGVAPMFIVCASAQVVASRRASALHCFFTGVLQWRGLNRIIDTRTAVYPRSRLEIRFEDAIAAARLWLDSEE